MKRSFSNLLVHGILRARWVLPISQPPIQDGAVAIEEGRIVKLGKAKEILKSAKAPVHDLGNAILLPGLVNAHTHLEYSCLKGKIQPSHEFTDWLSQMIELKKELKKQEIIQGIQKALQELIQTGTVLVGEITNTGFTAKILQRAGLSGTIFYELVGNTPFKAYLRIEQILQQEAPSFQIAPSCHTPHTVPFPLIATLRNYLRKTGKRTSIHAAESSSEIEWIQDKKGSLSELLHDKNLIQNPDFGKGLSPIEYLKNKNFLNPSVLCVHCIHLSPNELRMIKKARCFVALCPRSNQYTGAGKAPIQEFLNLKIPLCLGTDSLASNHDLSLWNEMKALKKIFPFLTYPFILRMSTLGGAEALGFGKTHGSIEKGKRASFIYVQTESKRIQNPYKFLIEEAHEKISRYDSDLWTNDSI